MLRRIVSRRCRWFCVVLPLVTSSLGCQYLPFGQSTAEKDDLAGLMDDEAPADDENDPNFDATVEAGEFQLKLAKGRRFPLMKTVEQRITQASPNGTIVGYSKLELALSLVVEELRDNDCRLSVKYHRVRFAQDLGGQVVSYNSEEPAATIPPEALVYSGMKDNGFSFWLGADNQVLDLVGFDEFLQRCLRNVPADQRAAVAQQLQAMRTEDGLANFVDDSIGLLPNAAPGASSAGSLRIGSTWDVPVRKATRGDNAPSVTRCRLTNLDDRTAEIALAGSIGPASYTDEVRRMRMNVRGGQTVGNCTVDRETGMPTKSRVERAIEMTAELADGKKIDQRKEVITTITAFLEQGATRPSASREEAERGRRQASRDEIETAPAPEQPRRAARNF